MERVFPDRIEAGRLLAEKLEKYANRDDVIVLGLPRGGVPVANEVAKSQAIEAVTAQQTAELERREEIYREGRPAPELRDWIVILVDDGLATGATMRAAVKALRQRGAAKIVVAVPVGPPDTCHEIEEQADETICLSTPEFFQAVGQYYDDFSQTTDEDVRELLVQAAQEQK